MSIVVVNNINVTGFVRELVLRIAGAFIQVDC